MYQGKAMNEDVLFQMRAADKRLMLYGEFKPQKMMPPGVRSSDFSAGGAR
jgi:hypothetical protein